MAIIQISKIQQRSGNLVDLPQLDEAQFGWASDAKRLFIGKTTPNENIEVLTSYSNISFSQIDGSDGGNFNINGPTNGSVLTYVDTTNTWENWPSANILDANASFKLNLGDAGNINIAGGATGYVLETDGVGNLAWTSKGTLRTTIVNLVRDAGNANIIVMRVAATTPYVNGLGVTISGANATNANSIVNGETLYVKVSDDFPTSGNVTLYTDAGLTTPTDGTNLGAYTANSGIATALISGSGVSNAGGSVNTIQFNNSGVLDGSANFTLTGGNLVTLSGNFVASNVSGGNLVTANFFAGTLTTAAQPNITSTGTLASLSVTGNANVGNLNTAGNVIASQVTANSNGTGNNFKVGDDAYIGDINVVNTMVVKGQQDGAQGYIVFGNTNSTSYIGRNGSNAITVTGAFSVTGNANVGNIGATNIVGTLSTAAQPNITSTGTLAGLVVSGAITPSANITYDLGNNTNRFKDLYLSNSTIYLGSQTISANATSVSISGNIVGNITGTITGAATTAGTVTTAAQPNITSTGTLASLSVSGNANIGNIGTAGLVTATGNITGGNLVTGGVVSASGNATVLGIKTDNYYYANGVAISFAGSYTNSNVATFLASYGSNTISTTGNITGGNVITSKYLINSIQTGISAAGSTQGTGTALGNTVNIVSTVASGAGVVLPTAVAGMTVYITNTSANSLLVYPATGAVINELSTNVGYSQATKATIHYVAASSTQWYSVGATYA